MKPLGGCGRVVFGCLNQFSFSILDVLAVVAAAAAAVAYVVVDVGAVVGVLRV